MTTHAVVTGAAGAIGAAIAKEMVLRDRGVSLTLIDVAEERASAIARSLDGDHEALAWDLSDVASLAARVEALVSRRGPIDTLINCAGVMEIRSLAGTPWDVGERLVTIDLMSPLRLMSLVVPDMVARRSGMIVNVSSMAGVTPLRGCSYYGAAKAGLAMASEIAHLELAPSGVHVVTVYPGPVRSELERRARAQASPGLVASLLPTGDAGALASRVMDACERHSPRVVYPALYDVASRFPTIASRVTRAWSPAPLA